MLFNIFLFLYQLNIIHIYRLEESDLTTPFTSHGKTGKASKKKFELGQDDEGEEADNEKNSSSSSNNSD